MKQERCREVQCGKKEAKRVTWCCEWNMAGKAVGNYSRMLTRVYVWKQGWP